MATYKALRAAIRDVVDGLSGWTPAKTLRPERIAAQEVGSAFVVGFLGGDTDSLLDAGDVGQTEHEAAVQFLERIDGQDEQASQDAALDRIEAVRDALCTANALGSVDAYASYTGYDMTDIGGYFQVSALFTVTQIHPY